MGCVHLSYVRRARGGLKFVPAGRNPTLRLQERRRGGSERTLVRSRLLLLRDSVFQRNATLRGPGVEESAAVQSKVSVLQVLLQKNEVFPSLGSILTSCVLQGPKCRIPEISHVVTGISPGRPARRRQRPRRP